MYPNFARMIRAPPKNLNEVKTPYCLIPEPVGVPVIFREAI